MRWVDALGQCAELMPTTMATAPDWLLFDLGGVLIDWAGPRELPALLPPGTSTADLKLRMSNDAATHDYERGLISTEQFAERFVRDWALPVTPVRLQRLYREWLRDLYPGVPALLARLRKRFRLACLSNCNVLHWEHNDGMLLLRRLLDVPMSSHELGLRKPDAEIFRVALHRLGAEPAQVGYFDDLQPNVEAASALGLRAYQVDGIADLSGRLNVLGWLPD